MMLAALAAEHRVGRAIRQHHHHRRHRRESAWHRHGFGAHRGNGGARPADSCADRLVSSPLRVTLSVPSVVGTQGVVRAVEPELSDDERAALQRSADWLKAAVARIKI